MNVITNCFSAASIVISPKVGVHVQLMRYLSAFIPDSIAKPNSEIISDAPVPTTCAPISVSSSFVINLTKPFVSSNDKARPLAGI